MIKCSVKCLYELIPIFKPRNSNTMDTTFLHRRESSEDTEQHLQENIEKYEADAVFLHKLMLRGERLTRQMVVEKYKINDRRLGDLFISGKCEKEWVLNENGKRKWVEYFITAAKLPTKSECIERSAKIIDLMKTVGKEYQHQGKLFK